MKKTSARGLLTAASSVDKPRTRRGRHVDAAERRRGAALEKALREAGAKDARVEVKAVLPGREGRIEIEVPLSGVHSLAKLLARWVRS